MKDLKIKLENEEQSTKIQEKLFEKNIMWYGETSPTLQYTDAKILVIDGNRIFYAEESETDSIPFDEATFEETMELLESEPVYTPVIKNFKMRTTPEQSEEVQETLLKKGITWFRGQTSVINTDAGNIIVMGEKMYISHPEQFEEVNQPEITFEDFMELVKEEK